MRNIALLALLTATLLTAQAARADDARIINANGEATVYVRPDQVIVNVGVETWNKSLADAKAANDAASRKLLAAIHGLGVEEKDVQSDVMQVQIDYPSEGAKRGIDGYFCRRAYAITLRDTTKFEALIDAALTNGANYLMGFEFRTTELRKHRDEARQLAVRAAKEKATSLASELGMTVCAPRNINEGAIGYWEYNGGWWGWGGGRDRYMSQNVIQQSPGGGGEGGETLPLGQIAVHAQVSVTFDMSK